MSERERLIGAARVTIAQGSQSFAAASKLFARVTRERAWLLYAWCRAADDMTDGQELGHGTRTSHDPVAAQARLESFTAAALDSEDPVPLPFAALRQVAREVPIPRQLITDHLSGFALDAAQWRPRSSDDLLRYCYHVAGTVGCMIAVVMGVDPDDTSTLDRACDLGIAFQLANIARDIVPDALAGRFYLPLDWLDESGLNEADLIDPAKRLATAAATARLFAMAEPYRRSARVGCASLPLRSRLAVLAADAIYGAIGEQVTALGPRAWDTRVQVSRASKLRLIVQAGLRSMRDPEPAPRDGLWTRSTTS